jgi:FtsZ-binding cell division protein ZapB
MLGWGLLLQLNLEETKENTASLKIEVISSDQNKSKHKNNGKTLASTFELG